MKAVKKVKTQDKNSNNKTDKGTKGTKHHLCFLQLKPSREEGCLSNSMLSKMQCGRSRTDLCTERKGHNGKIISDGDLCSVPNLEGNVRKNIFWYVEQSCEQWGKREDKEGCEQRRSTTVPLSSGLTRWGFLSALGISGLRAEKRNMVRTRVTSSVWHDWLETQTTERKTLSQVNTTKHWHKYTILLPHDYYTVYVLVGAHQCGLVMFDIYTWRK